MLQPDPPSRLRSTLVVLRAAASWLLLALGGGWLAGCGSGAAEAEVEETGAAEGTDPAALQGELRELGYCTVEEADAASELDPVLMMQLGGYAE